MLGLLKLVYSTCLSACVLASPIIWDGRAPFNLTNADLETSTGPFLTYVTYMSFHVISANSKSTQCGEGIGERNPCQ